jgi:hypothetical protein
MLARLAPISNVAEPLEDNSFLSVRLIANSPAAIYEVLDELLTFGSKPVVVVRLITILLAIIGFSLC